jgi:hypothetical protein
LTLRRTLSLSRGKSIITSGSFSPFTLLEIDCWTPQWTTIPTPSSKTVVSRTAQDISTCLSSPTRRTKPTW